MQEDEAGCQQIVALVSIDEAMKRDPCEEEGLEQDYGN
jgi:hypothetical protein